MFMSLLTQIHIYLTSLRSKGHDTKQFFLQLATQRWRIKNLPSCRGGVTRLQLFSQLATRTITNKMADASWNLPRAKDELWLAHSDKIALQVAGGVLHTSNLSRNVAKSRGSFYFSSNSQRNNCSCKMGCYKCATFLALQVARKIASCNMVLSVLVQRAFSAFSARAQLATKAHYSLLRRFYSRSNLRAVKMRKRLSFRTGTLPMQATAC